MSCCGDAHDAQHTDCGEVLAELWLFLDKECNHERRELLQRHLDECGSCLEKYGLEEHLKALLARKCGGDHAPDELRNRLRESIQEIVMQQAVLGAEVTVEQDATGAVIEVWSSAESHGWLREERWRSRRRTIPPGTETRDS